ncbi:histidine-rich glycoprotein [Musca domestica]|uniref:Histidine-rich glycoprotein n=1 Tax=Musca domestica TaxID=7370 RepID=A0A1I8MGW9_MUSDO|nr:histidine-rich glycoprotein [Musca domestica]
MNSRQLCLHLFLIFGLALVLYTDSAAAGSHAKKKKITIHVPVHKKIEKHTHTIVKHIHHHHKPIVLKEEKKIIEEHHPIIKKEHVSHEHHHHHEAKHDHQHDHKHAEFAANEYDDEEEHVHHHHSYEHKSTHNEEVDDDFMERH